MAPSQFTTRLTNVLFDPSFHFNLSCIVLTFLWSINDTEKVVSNLRNPFFLSVVAVMILCEIYPQCLSFYDCFVPSLSNNKILSLNKRKSTTQINLGYKQSMIARWYLQNALVTHLLMDGISGIYNVFPIMHEVYLELDERFHEPLSVKGIIATMTVQMELFFMCPLSLLLYYGYRCHVNGVYTIKDNSSGNNGNNGSYTMARYPAWVYGLEIIVSVLHISGTYFYDIAEWVHIVFNTGLASVPVDWNFEFTLDYLLYFWFGFVIAPIFWIVVPIYMIKRSIHDLGLLIGDYQRKDVNISVNVVTNGNTKKKR